MCFLESGLEQDQQITETLCGETLQWVPGFADTPGVGVCPEGLRAVVDEEVVDLDEELVERFADGAGGVEVVAGGGEGPVGVEG